MLRARETDRKREAALEREGVTRKIHLYSSSLLLRLEESWYRVLDTQWLGDNSGIGFYDSAAEAAGDGVRGAGEEIVPRVSSGSMENWLYRRWCHTDGAHGIDARRRRG